MATLAHLLSPEARARLENLVPATVAVLHEGEPARRTLTAADAIDIDAESEAMIEAECVDCTAPVLIDPKLPEGVDPETPRVPLCRECGRDRAKEATKARRKVEVIQRTRTAKHKPRVTDGLSHPVQVTRKKESAVPEIDLSNMSTGEKVALVTTATERLESNAATALPAKRDAAKAQAKAEAKAVEKAAKAERKARQNTKPLVEFTVGTLVVPALDLSEVTSLDEAVSAVMRSPYNKARFRLLGEPPLPTLGDCEEDASLPPTTYAVLAAEHLRLSQVAEAKRAEAKPAKKVRATVAVLDEDEVALKVEALRSVCPDLSKKQARKIVADLG